MDYMETMAHYQGIGAINVKLTEDEIKELESDYVAQEAVGHN